MLKNKIKKKLPTLYWLSELHERPCKSCVIASSSSRTTRELSILLTLVSLQLKPLMLNSVKQFIIGIAKVHFGLSKFR